jgi:hypothetical protein
LNQIQFANTAGAQLNEMLMKVLALHAIQNSANIDADAAEYASFTLYLLSNHGFSVRQVAAAVFFCVYAALTPCSLLS